MIVHVMKTSMQPRARCDLLSTLRLFSPVLSLFSRTVCEWRKLGRKKLTRRIWNSGGNLFLLRLHLVAGSQCHLHSAAMRNSQQGSEANARMAA